MQITPVSMSFGSHRQIYKDSETNKALLPVLIGATAVSILGAMTLISQIKTGKGAAADFLNNAKIGKELISEVKDFNMFKPKTYSNLIKNMKYGPLDIIAMAGASAGGGLAAGCLIDGKNKRAKLEETIYQMVGNILFPIASITATNALIPKTVFKPLRILASLGAGALGIFAGNKVANRLNNHIFKDKEQRCIKFSDMTAHVDDACATVGLAGKGISFCENFAKILPAALPVAGVSIGLADEEDVA